MHECLGLLLIKSVTPIEITFGVIAEFCSQASAGPESYSIRRSIRLLVNRDSPGFVAVIFGIHTVSVLIPFPGSEDVANDTLAH